MKIIIVGAGIAGTAAALSLTKWMQPPPSITIVEIRPEPSTMGGAIGLTPNALRALDALGVLTRIRKQAMGIEVNQIELFNVYTAAKIGEIDFKGTDRKGVGSPPYKGLRVMRSDLLRGLLQTVEALDNVSIIYGATTTALHETEQDIRLVLADNRELPADLVIGADGIHSAVRMLHVEPERKPTYTGIAAVGASCELSQLVSLSWEDTALGQSQRGSIMCSYCDQTRQRHYIAAVMETADVKSKEGWVAMGKEQEKLKEKVKERYVEPSVRLPGLGELVEGSRDWHLYPVFALGPRGKWSTNRCLLVGDAAHAVSPKQPS
jgi:salicylate hydroxylase